VNALARAWGLRVADMLWWSPVLRKMFRRLDTGCGTDGKVESHNRRLKYVDGTKSELRRRSLDEAVGGRMEAMQREELELLNKWEQLHDPVNERSARAFAAQATKMGKRALGRSGALATLQAETALVAQAPAPAAVRASAAAAVLRKATVREGGRVLADTAWSAPREAPVVGAADRPCADAADAPAAGGSDGGGGDDDAGDGDEEAAATAAAAAEPAGLADHVQTAKEKKAAVAARKAEEAARMMRKAQDELAKRAAAAQALAAEAAAAEEAAEAEREATLGEGEYGRGAAQAPGLQHPNCKLCQKRAFDPGCKLFACGPFCCRARCAKGKKGTRCELAAHNTVG
jgi:hypothetical protein